MILSDDELKGALDSGELGISPAPEEFEPSSVDLHLDKLILKHSDEPVEGMNLDPTLLDISDHLTRYTEAASISEHGYLLGPGMFLIGRTFERVSLSNGIAGRVEGKSSLARLGMGVHITAPKIDPGFDNQITLEIFNLGPFTIKLSDQMKVC